MATHERPHIRPPALRHVLAARSSQNQTDTTPRIFKVPLLNFETQDYTELINWSSTKRVDPPMFQSFQSTQLEENIHTSDMLQLKIIFMPRTGSLKGYQTCDRSMCCQNSL